MNQSSTFDFIESDVARQELLESLPRIKRAYRELLSGYELSGRDILNRVVDVDDYSGTVTVQNINYYTFCKHHFLPFFGQASVEYQPNKVITGLGKIVRLVRDVHSRRLQIQELMARDIANDMQEVLEPQGVRIRLTAKHLCTCSRGPSDDTNETVVVYETGTLRTIRE